MFAGKLVNCSGEPLKYHLETVHELFVDFTKLQDENDENKTNIFYRSVTVGEDLFEIYKILSTEVIS